MVISACSRTICQIRQNVTLTNFAIVIFRHSCHLKSPKPPFSWFLGSFDHLHTRPTPSDPESHNPHRPGLAILGAGTWVLCGESMVSGGSFGKLAGLWTYPKESFGKPAVFVAKRPPLRGAIWTLFEGWFLREFSLELPGQRGFSLMKMVVLAVLAFVADLRARAGTAKTCKNCSFGSFCRNSETQGEIPLTKSKSGKTRFLEIFGHFGVQSYTVVHVYQNLPKCHFNEFCYSDFSWKRPSQNTQKWCFGVILVKIGHFGHLAYAKSGPNLPRPRFGPDLKGACGNCKNCQNAQTCRNSETQGEIPLTKSKSGKNDRPFDKLPKTAISHIFCVVIFEKWENSLFGKFWSFRRAVELICQNSAKMSL